MKRLLLAFPLPLLMLACSSADGSYAAESSDGGALEETSGDTRTPAVTPTDGGTTVVDAAHVDSTPPPPPPPDLEPAKDLSINELALFQGVKVPLEKDGVRDDAKKVHIVAGREGLLRVYVTPATGFTAREVVAELTLQADGKAPTILKATKTVSGPSDDATLDSTINITVPSGAIEMGAKYKVRLLTKPGVTAGTVKGAAFPEGGALEALDVYDTGDSFKVTLVPVKANGYVPDTSDAQIERYRKQLQAMYPVKKIELKVHAVFEYTGIYARGTGIYGLLDAVTALRKKDGAPSDVYYYGIFAPTSSYSTYCIGSCTTGLCHLPGPSDTFLRACVGVGFTGSSSAGTMAHELGHAHGIPHSPCGSVAGADSKYPYSGGKLGSWGYDERTGTLLSPTKNYDFMSYCGPEWISDYAYDRITHRMSAVREEPMIYGSLTQSYRFVHVTPEGTIEWGDEITLDEPMSGEPHDVTYVTT
ncbi:MAG: M66 family metalloprotease, partial [Polyangiales bacterium]